MFKWREIKRLSDLPARTSTFSQTRSQETLSFLLSWALWTHSRCLPINTEEKSQSLLTFFYSVHEGQTSHAKYFPLWLNSFRILYNHIPRSKLCVLHVVPDHMAGRHPGKSFSAISAWYNLKGNNLSLLPLSWLTFQNTSLQGRMC